MVSFTEWQNERGVDLTKTTENTVGYFHFEGVINTFIARTYFRRQKAGALG